MDHVRAWFEAILRDFQATPATAAEVRLLELDPQRPDEHRAVLPDPSSWIDRNDPTRHRLLLVVDRNVTGLDPDQGAGAVAVEIASRLQDFVIDELWRPWPTVTVDGRAVVLEPRLGPTGEPRWQGSDGTWCPLGGLREQFDLGDA